MVNSLESFDSDAGNLEAIKALVEAGADVSLAADGGVTPLHAAAELGGLDLVNLLLKVLPVGHAALGFPAITPFACLLLWCLSFQVIAVCLPSELWSCLFRQILVMVYQFGMCPVVMVHSTHLKHLV